MHSVHDRRAPALVGTFLDQRRCLLDLSRADLATGLQLQEQVIGPRLELIIAAFYDRLVEFEPFQEIMAQGYDVASLRSTQSKYLRSLGVNFHQQTYMEQRIRVGVVHDRVGLPLSAYLCAYRLLQQLLIDAVRAEISDPKEQQRLSDFVLKITALDISLAIEAYHGIRVHSLEQSIQNLGAREREQRQRAETDALTGAANRESLFDALRSALDQQAVDGAPLCLAIADLDHFKRVNDQHGHLVGDGVLRDVVARLSAGFRGSDLVCRYGGEEFAVVLTHTDLSQALEICERVRERVAATPVAVGALTVQVTMSFGVAQSRPEDHVESLFARADRALYRAKETGRNRVCPEADAAGR